MSAATVGGTLNCTMCGYRGVQTMTLCYGERYTCPGCKQEGAYQVGGLMPLPWDACPRGFIPSLWAAAVEEIKAEELAERRRLADLNPARF